MHYTSFIHDNGNSYVKNMYEFIKTKLGADYVNINFIHNAPIIKIKDNKVCHDEFDIHNPFIKKATIFSCKEWGAFYHKNQFQKEDILNKCIYYNFSDIFVWDNFSLTKKEKDIMDLRKNYDIYNGITIKKRNKENLISISLATRNKHHEIHEVTTNNFDVIEVVMNCLYRYLHKKVLSSTI